MSYHRPLIITLALSDTDQQFFNVLRKTHFPSHSNYLQAHITLFHSLPSDEPFITEQLAIFAQRTTMTLQVSRLSNMGHGVAYSLISEDLQQLHVRMQEAFKPWLMKQDQQKLWPHITIQNKVTTFKAQQLYEQLQADFTPFDVKATGFNTWIYLKGPWKAVANYSFLTTDATAVSTAHHHK